MTELSFLLELLLNHKLPKVTREAVTQRVKEVEVQLTLPRPAMPGPSPGPNWTGPIGPNWTGPINVPPHLVGQSPSTIAAMMRHEANGVPPPIIPKPVEVPVPIVAVTPAAQAALMDRANAINQAVSGKPEKGRTSPRKF